VLTKEVHKKNQAHREKYLRAELFASFDVTWKTEASSCEDVVDAAISAVCMQKNLVELKSLPAATNQERIEGKIWMPDDWRTRGTCSKPVMTN
jgi:hypothetical protein